MTEPGDPVFDEALARLTPERWDEIAAALAAVEADGAFTRGWSSTEPHFPGDTHHSPFPLYTDGVRRLTRSLSEGDLTIAFDWMRWPGFTEHWAAERFAAGSSADALRLVITAVRGERFSDGFIESLLETGRLQAAVKRLLEARPIPS